jgi:hypothetical protein
MTTVPLVAGPLQQQRRAQTSRRWRVRAGAALTSSILTFGVAAQEPVPPPDTGVAATLAVAPTAGLTRAQQEALLLKGRVIATRPAGTGITGSLRVTLTDGALTHDAHVQTVDEHRARFEGASGVQRNFRDSWRYNVAAYRLALLLGLDMVPVTVERSHRQRRSSFTWWVDDVIMDESARQKQNVRAPDPAAWTRQMYVMRVFDQLIDNTDRNLGNLLIDSAWQVWMIDHTRAFRMERTLRTPTDLRGCDRTVLARLEALDMPTINRELARWLDLGEMEALLARRDLILEFFRTVPPGALFDLPRREAMAQR